jgi:hypothetical protein
LLIVFFQDYATTYRLATRDACLKAADELKLATGQYKRSRDVYVASGLRHLHQVTLLVNLTGCWIPGGLGLDVGNSNVISCGYTENALITVGFRIEKI